MIEFYVGVEPKIGGKLPPKWMVKIMEKPIEIHDLGVPLFLETPMLLSNISNDISIRIVIHIKSNIKK